MRVAVFSDSVAPRVDGIAVVVRQFVTGLVRQGHEVLLVGPVNEKPRTETAGVRIVQLPSIRTPFDGYPLTIPRRREAAHALLDFDPDVISIQTVGPAAFLGLSLAAQHEIAIILAWHTDFEFYTRMYPIGRALAVSGYLALLLDHHATMGRRRRAARRQRAVGRKGIAVLGRGAVPGREGVAGREGVPGREALLSREGVVGRAILLGHGIRAGRRFLMGRTGHARIIARSLRLVGQQTSAVWAPSGSAVRQMREFGLRCPVFVLPADVLQQHLGVGSPAALRALERIPGRGSRSYLLYVGRLSREKNLKLLLAAFVRLALVDPAAMLVLVGPAHDAQIQQMLQPYLRDHAGQVVVLDPLPRNALGEIYGRATAFVTPSTSDTQCLCVSEALSLGVPVLVVDPGLAEDRPAGTVRVVEPDPVQLAAAMSEELTRSRRRARRPVAVGARTEPGTWTKDSPGGVVPRQQGRDERSEFAEGFVRPRRGDEIGREEEARRGGGERLPQQRGLVVRPRDGDSPVRPPNGDLAARFVSAVDLLPSAHDDATYRWDGWSWAEDKTGSAPRQG